MSIMCQSQREIEVTQNALIRRASTWSGESRVHRDIIDILSTIGYAPFI